jgi:hypothetical protein
MNIKMALGTNGIANFLMLVHILSLFFLTKEMYRTFEKTQYVLFLNERCLLE